MVMVAMDRMAKMFDTDELKKVSKIAEIDAKEAMTLDEKRIAIGQRILAAAKEQAPHSEDDDDLDQHQLRQNYSAVHKSLMNKVGKLEGTFRFRFATKLKKYVSNHKSLNAKIKTIRGHRLSVTCMALDPTGKDRYVITGSKDGSIIKWDLQTGRRIMKLWHAWPLNDKNKKSKKTGKKLKRGGLRYNVWKRVRPKPVLAVAISPDERWLVSAGEDKLIRVWNAQTMKFKSTFKGGHRSKITGLAFSREDNVADRDDESGNFNTLFSTGEDRQIRVYDMNEMGFAEALFGHTEGVNSIAATSEDRCVTVSDDKTVRYWKLRTQSQLVFQEGHDECIDACCIITPGRFVTGSQDGSIALWSTAKKNPLQKESNVHLSPDPMDVKHQKGTLRHWIVSLSAKHNCDVFASGSSDGVIKLWTVRNNSFYHLRSIRIPKGGFVNCMQWTDSGQYLICGLGDEHRLGRWEHVNGARNGIAIIKLPMGWEDPEIRKDVNPFYEDDDDDDDDKKEEMQNGNLKEKDGEEEEGEKKPEMNGHHKKGENIRKKEPFEVGKDIEFEKAEEWDKWDPRERGQIVKDESKKKKKNKVKDFLGDDEDDDADDWQSFFGNVFT